MRSAAQRKRALRRRLATIGTGLAGVALLYALLGGRDEADVEFGEAREQRGYFVTDATLTEMGPDGRPRIVVRARSIEQQLPDQSVELADLALDYLTRDSGKWHVTARNGRMPPDRGSLLLSGEVTITGATDSTGTAVIRTDRLSYDVDSGVVQTAEPVSVNFGRHELSGRGLLVRLNDGTLKLESNVHGRFTP
jgi:LPS export ABC transporter protein LptC